MSPEEVQVLIEEIRRGGTVTLADIARSVNVSLATVNRWAAGSLFAGDDELVAKLQSLAQEGRVWLLKVLPVVVLGWAPGETLEATERTSPPRHWASYFSSVSLRPATRRGDVLRCDLTLEKDVDFSDLAFMVRAAFDTRVTLSYDGTPPGGKTLRFPRKRSARTSYVFGTITLFLHYSF